MNIIPANLETNYIIYGAGEVGERCTRNLLNAGANVVAVIDKNKENGFIASKVPIYRLQNENLSKDNTIVIICLANGTLHKEVADCLSEKGFKHIVFLPLGLSLSYKKQQQMTKLYNELLNGELGSKRLIEPYYDYKKIEYDIQSPILNENNDKLTVWVNQEILFSESYENWPGDKAKLTGISEAYDKNIVARKWYRLLFNYFDGKNVDSNEYFQLFTTKNDTKDKLLLLQERESLYRTFSSALNRGNITFFTDSAPDAAWNINGYFNLIGGHHRTVFLLHSGFTFYPIKITMEDFDKWTNLTSFHNLKQYMLENNIADTIVPIPHPAFFHVNARREIIAPTLLDSVVTFLHNQNESFKSALDLSPFDGYFARISKRMRINDVVCWTQAKKIFIQLINQLLYLDDIITEQKDFTIFSECSPEKFDIVFIMNFVEEINNRENIMPIMINAAQLTNKYLFYETSCEEDFQNIVAVTDFTDYQILHKEYYMGKMLRMGVFKKNAQ